MVLFNIIYIEFFIVSLQSLPKHIKPFKSSLPSNKYRVFQFNILLLVSF